MIKREQITEILRVNGLSLSFDDEEIKSVLISSKFNKDEIDTAVIVSRKNVKTNFSRIEGLHKVFRTNESLSSQEISELLGIGVDLPSVKDVNLHKDKDIQVFISAGIAVLIVVVSATIYMLLN